MGKKSATASDVARFAGVSQPTVSRVFSPHKGNRVNKDIAERVRQAAAELGYQPNIIARSLASGKTNIIGLVIGGVSGPYYNLLVRKLINRFQTIGKQVLVFDLERHKNIEDIVTHVLSYNADGIVILAAALSTEIISKCRDYETPIIIVNRKVDIKNVNYITSNHQSGGAVVAEYILQRNYKNIIYVSSNEGNNQEHEIRKGFDGFLSISASSVKVRDIAVNYGYDGGITAGREIIGLDFIPDLIFCTSDVWAVGIIDTLRGETNWNIPKDVGIIGYDNAYYTEWGAYKLTTVEQPQESIIESVVTSMDQLLQNKNNDIIKKEFDLKLIKRETTT